MKTPNKSLTFTTAKIPLPAGIDPQRIAESDAAIVELQSCQKRGLESAKKCGEIWACLLDTAAEKMEMVNWLHHRYDFSQRSIYLYVDVHKKWAEKVKKANELGIHWETMSINEFLAIGKEAKVGKNGKDKNGNPVKKSAKPTRSQGTPEYEAGQLADSIKDLAEKLKALPQDKFQESVKTFFELLGGKVKKVKPGSEIPVNVKFGSKPILLVPWSEVAPKTIPIMDRIRAPRKAVAV
jgi:hypothetical protein